jgi:hypothetical protein
MVRGLATKPTSVGSDRIYLNTWAACPSTGRKLCKAKFEKFLY